MDSPNTSADFFANSSTETVTQNDSTDVIQIATTSYANELETHKSVEQYPPNPVIDSETLLSLSANSSQLLSEFLLETNLATRICCPFCTFDFGFEVLLKDHIKASHGRELNIVLKSKPGDVKFHQCPFCQAKFYSKEFLPKHIIAKHELCVVNMFSGFSPEKYVYCRFCPHKILRKHYKLLMIHIEKKHFLLFEKFILAKYSNITNSCEDIINMETKSDEVHYDLPISLEKNHQKEIKETDTALSPSVKSILKPKTAYPLDTSEKLTAKKQNLMYANLTLHKKSSRRKLRFNIPESEDNEAKENVPCKKSKLTLNTKTKKISEKDVKVNAVAQIPKNKDNFTEQDQFFCQLNRFKCGLCSEAFAINTNLLEHIRKKHKGLKLVAQYRCGECNAKFFRNRYLVKHCWRHHSPLCLKNSILKKDFIMF